ncbi:DUF5680 domain-containing protein [Caldiplasma sukawensis]
MNEEIFDFLNEVRSKLKFRVTDERKSVRKIYSEIYKKGEFEYINNFSGTNSFSGIEYIMKNSVPVFSIVYSGITVYEDFPYSSIKHVIEEALSKTEREFPVRGPQFYTVDNFTYENQWEGEIDYFMGYETVKFDDEIIYEQHYSGCLIE